MSNLVDQYTAWAESQDPPEHQCTAGYVRWLEAYVAELENPWVSVDKPPPKDTEWLVSHESWYRPAIAKWNGEQWCAFHADYEDFALVVIPQCYAPIPSHPRG